MEYRTLGSSGCVVSTFTLGTMTFGHETDEAGAHAQLDAFVAAGGNLIDTADVYTPGASEEIIGRWLARQPESVRSQVVLTTKGRFPMGDGPNDVGLSRRHLSDALDASLRRLQVDSVDMYQVHAWDPLTPLEETWGFLDDAVRAGKVRYLGLSNFAGWQIQKAADLALLSRACAARHAAAAVQPARPRDRVGDHPRVRGERARPAAVVAARRRLADRQVHARRAPERRDAAGGGPGARRGGLRPPQHAGAHVGRDRRRPEDRDRARRVDGADRARLGRRSSAGHVRDPRRAHAASSSRTTSAPAACTSPQRRRRRSTR